MSWKYYVYSFFKHGACVYVGKGSGKRFDVQKKRFKDCAGSVIAYFKKEQDALSHEWMLIQTQRPAFNIAMMPKGSEPWKTSLLPEKEKDFYFWCDALGTRQMAVRVLLSKSWTSLRAYGVDVKALLSKLENCEVFNGLRC